MDEQDTLKDNLDLPSTDNVSHMLMRNRHNDSPIFAWLIAVLQFVQCTIVNITGALFYSYKEADLTFSGSLKTIMR